MLRELRSAFSPLATTGMLRDQIRAAEAPHLQLLLRLALSRVPEATLKEICESHIIAFTIVDQFGAAARLTMRSVSVLICHYWASAAREQAFALRDPRRFQEAVRKFSRPTVENAARLLLLAAQQTDTRLSDDLAKRLLALAG